MKIWYVGLVLILAVGVLAGCGGEQATPAPADESAGETYTSASLDTSYDGALNASSQLVLGTLQLEETDYAVTPEQAASLLPLWQAMQGGVTAQAEVNALLKQIEGTMTQEQLSAITAMQLTQDDLRTWAQSRGLSLGAPPGAQPPGGDKGGQGGGRGELSPEEMEALRATAEAGGGRAGGAGTNQLAILLEPLVELLTQRAAE